MGAYLSAKCLITRQRAKISGLLPPVVDMCKHRVAGAYVRVCVGLQGQEKGKVRYKGCVAVYN